MSNKGAKGHAFETFSAGETKTLLDIQGCGTVHRIWMTISKRDPVSLRSVRIEMFWDNSATPAVSAPLGDFFCDIHGHMLAFENELFSNPEGRSFNCSIPMPFRTAAKITVTNDSDQDISHIFYDVNFILCESHENDVLYFHAYWSREHRTTIAQDFEILPSVKGSGRFIGTHIGVITNPGNVGWWGEGEFKAYLDGDSEHPTLAGTGTEDYIGTAWGQGVYNHTYQGCLIADGEKGMFGFYRYHINDPIYFHSDCRITMQQIGGTGKKEVLEQLQKGASIKPVSIDAGEKGFIRLLEGDGKRLDDASLPDGWTNFYRRDDWSATAFFYLDSPENGLPKIATVKDRIAGLEEKEMQK
ncbi:MAG: DUF2961 domain-containing protein [Candidatus Latescibacteria bacterium]|nr:DUF2961 domain-containing protein [Candidatus Latescibacterota bacterium]